MRIPPKRGSVRASPASLRLEAPRPQRRWVSGRLAALSIAAVLAFTAPPAAASAGPNQTAPAPGTADATGAAPRHGAHAAHQAGQPAPGGVTKTVIGTVPDAPTSVTATQRGTLVTVRWAAPSNPGSSPITGYDIAVSDGRSVSGLSVPANLRSAGFGRLTPGAYTFSVAASNAAGVSQRASVALRVTPTDRPLTLDTTVTRMTFGQGLTLRGTGTAGATVVLRRAFPGGRFKRYASYTVNPFGEYSADVRLAHTSRFRASSEGRTTHTRKVTVAHRVTLNAVRRGFHRYRLSGHVGPAHSGQVVRASYRRPDGTYARLGTDRTGPRGNWAVVVTLKRTTTYTFRARALGHRLNAASSAFRRAAVR